MALAGPAVMPVAFGWMRNGRPGPTPPGVVTGRVTVREKGNKVAADVGQAVVWLEGATPEPSRPKRFEVLTEGKDFRPHVAVVGTGTTVGFPNNDPFNHNVFSLSAEAPFDLGLYSRGQSKSVTFTRPGVIKVYCNVHATMSAFIIVRDNAHFTQPAQDGSFVLEAVPAGKYTLRAWHERAGDVKLPIDVAPAGLKGLDVQMDARGYKFVEHLNKFGQPYSKGGARY